MQRRHLVLPTAALHIEQDTPEVKIDARGMVFTASLARITDRGKVRILRRAGVLSSTVEGAAPCRASMTAQGERRRHFS
jgi:hypothetical protein